jgi:hypothetical protein
VRQQEVTTVKARHTREGGYPVITAVRETLGALEYWVARSSRAKTVVDAVATIANEAVVLLYAHQSHTTGLTPGSAVTSSRNLAPRISKLRY